MTKKIFALFLAVAMLFSIVGCNGTPNKDATKEENILPNYPEQKFQLSGFWAPYEITEEAFQQYKDMGLTTLNMINHSLDKTSENQFYLGSERTMKALEVCRKVGLKAILSYNDWIATWSENNPEYYSDTPFSQYDLYGDYKDIITGIHIVDEPAKRHYDGRYSSKAMMEDFDKVYPNAHYIFNLSPKHAGVFCRQGLAVPQGQNRYFECG